MTEDALRLPNHSDEPALALFAQTSRESHASGVLPRATAPVKKTDR